MSKGKSIQVEYKTLVVIWLALLASQLIFLVVVYAIKPHLLVFDATRSFFDDEPLITLAFAGSAVVFFVLSFLLRRQHIRRAVRDRDAGCIQTALVLGCALSEIASVLGLLLAILFEHPYFYLWIALGALGILLHFPRKGNLDAAVYGME